MKNAPIEIEPLRDYVILEEIKAEIVGGLILIHESIDLPPTQRGYVIAAGPEAPFKPKQQVMYKRHMFEEIVINEKPTLFGRAEGIFALINA